MYDIDELRERIWQNPDTATGLHWQNHGGKWRSSQRMDGQNTARADRTVLERRSSDGQIFYYYHGDGGGKQNGDIIELLQYIYGMNDVGDVIRTAAERYGIQPTFSGADAEQQRKAWKQRATMQSIAQDAAGILTAAMKQDSAAGIRTYLQGRGLQASEHFGVFSAAVRESLTRELKKKYDDGQAVDAAITSLFPVWRKDFSKDKAGTYIDFADAYGLIIPYYSGSRLYGFCMRLTAAKTPTYTDADGKVQDMPKYLYSKSRDKGGIMEKGGYCPAVLNPDEPVILVEGILDAIACIQAGCSNVMALGGMTPTDREDKANSSQIQTLKRYGAKHIIYMPDMETTADGQPKTAATERTIKALLPHLTGSIDGKGFLSLGIIWHDLQDAKDAADILHLYGKKTLLQCIDIAQPWHEWTTWQICTRNAGNLPQMAADFVDMYRNIQNPIERELIRRDMTTAAPDSPLQELKKAGITARSLQQIDRTGNATTYRSAMTEAIDSLKAAADKNADAETIGSLLKTAERVQNHTAALSFAAQVNATADILGTQIAQEGDYIETCWDMWKDYSHGMKEPTTVRKISFAPASVSVMAAPTSHGKTLVMLQTAIYLAKTRQEHVLYIGLENDAKQLYVRALAAYAGDSIKERNPRKAVRQYFKGQALRADLFADSNTRDTIAAAVTGYSSEVMPYLHLVRVNSDSEALCSAIAAQVEEWQNRGEHVAAVFIDYVQLLHMTGRNYSRTDEMKNICDGINELAKTTGLPVIVGSQMNRSATQRTDNKTPAIDGIDLYNLGESSGIENIAEDCFLIWDIDRTNEDNYRDAEGFIKARDKMMKRSRRIYAENEQNAQAAPILRRGHVYIEALKSREYETGCYCLIPAIFAAGTLNTKDKTKY